MPLSGPLEAAIERVVDLLDGDVLRLATNLKSTTETFGVGTRIETPSSLPFSSGSTRPTALAAPVEVGIMRQRRGAGAVEILVHGVERRLVAGIGMDGGHQALFDAEGIVAAPAASGARQLVVQDALEMTMWSFVSLSWLMP